MALGNLGKDNIITNIVAKVWRLDNDSWGYACKSKAWKSKTHFYCGKEPNRQLAMEAVESGIDQSLLKKGDHHG